MRRLLARILVLYAAFAAVAFFFSERMIFLPRPPSYADGADVLKIPSGDAVIAARYFSVPHAEGTILFSHGNACDIGDMQPAIDDLRAAGFSVFAYDYRGYGRSTGTPTEAGAVADALAAYDSLTRSLAVPPTRIIAMGHSLGAATAIDLATRRPVGALVVVSGFLTAFRVVTRVPLLPFDRFDNLAKIPAVAAPILVIHGRRDSVIPFAHGEGLFAAARSPKRSLWIDTADHNDVFDVGRIEIAAALRTLLR